MYSLSELKVNILNVNFSCDKNIYKLFCQKSIEQNLLKIKIFKKKVEKVR